MPAAVSPAARLAQAEWDVLVGTQLFVVRLWREEPERADAPNCWRGSVERAATGQLYYFSSLADLAAELSLLSGFPYPEP